MVLPEEIQEQIKHLIGKNCLYILHLRQVVDDNGDEGCAKSIYKFGMTTDIMNRLDTHKKELKFKRIINVFDCGEEQVMKNVENKLKNYAKAMDIFTPMFGKIEIITCDEKMIINVLDFIRSKGVVSMIDKEIVIEYKDVDEVGEVKLVKDERVGIKQTNKFKCDLCNKIFKDSYDLKRHRERKIPCIKPKAIEKQKCNQCNKIYSCASALNRHVLVCKMSGTEKFKEDRATLLYAMIKAKDEELKVKDELIKFIQKGYQSK